MSRQELLVVMIRLFALGLFLLTLRNVPSALINMQGVEGLPSSAIAFVIVTHVGILFVATALWRFPYGVSALLLPTVNRTVSSFSWSQSDVVETGSIVIGLFYALYALSDLVYWVSYLIAFGAINAPDTFLVPDQWAGVITTVVESGLALYLIFGATGISRFVQATRSAGRTAV